MPRSAQIVKDMQFDEVSLVDRPACPPAAIVIAKRADQEEGMDEYEDLELVDEDGNPIDLSQYEVGTVITLDDGSQFEVTYGDEDVAPEAAAEDQELVSVGKSAFGASLDPAVANLREELRKAVSDEDRDVLVSKAFDTLAKRAQAAEARLAKAEEIAKAEQNLRLEREYIAKAAEYNVPIPAGELGPVLMRMAENMSYEDCSVIHKALSAAGEMLYTEAGYDGRAAVEDPLAQIDAYLEEQVSKAGGGVSKAGAMTAFFDSNPEAYDAYRADRTR